MLIYSNNPKVREKYRPAHYEPMQIQSFLKRVRDQIHCGAKLLSDPLPASRRMLESPYRSVVLSKPEGAARQDVDLHSLETIEKALMQYERIKGMKMPVDQEVLQDFQYVDEMLLQSTLNELGVSWEV